MRMGWSCAGDGVEQGHGFVQPAFRAQGEAEQQLRVSIAWHEGQ
jgi:hypothetical protein